MVFQRPFVVIDAQVFVRFQLLSQSHVACVSKPGQGEERSLLCRIHFASQRTAWSTPSRRSRNAQVALLILVVVTVALAPLVPPKAEHKNYALMQPFLSLEVALSILPLVVVVVFLILAVALLVLTALAFVIYVWAAMHA